MSSADPWNLSAVTSDAPPPGAGWGLAAVPSDGLEGAAPLQQDSVVSPAGNMSSIGKAREALAAKRRARATATAKVALGLLRADDVIGLAAADGDDGPLLKVRLEQLIAAQPGVPMSEARRQVAHVRRIVPDNGRAATVHWLLDRRTDGRRQLAWHDARSPRHSPWPGFPFSVRPRGGAVEATLAGGD